MPSLRSEASSSRTVARGCQAAARLLRSATALRVTAATDRAGSPCGPAEKLALVQPGEQEWRREPLRCRGQPMQRHDSRVPGWPLLATISPECFHSLSYTPLRNGPQADATSTCRRFAQAAPIPARCGSNRTPSRSIAQATFSSRSATERRARACPWPRARSDRYLSWLTGSRWAATRAQW